MMFPAFYKSKIFAISSDIVILDKSDGEPIFDLISGIGAFAKCGMVLDLQKHMIQIDHVVIVMRPYTSLARRSNMRVEVLQPNNMYAPPSTGTFSRDHLERISIRKAIKRTIEIVDSDYEKANLPEITKDTCKYFSIEQSKPL